MKFLSSWICILCILTIIISGCIDGSRYTNEMKNSGYPNTDLTSSNQKFSSNLTFDKTLPNSEVKWIRIDDVGVHHLGDVFNITGSTNLAEGNELLFQVYFASFQQGSCCKYNSSGSEGVIYIEKGRKSDINEWQFVLNTSSSNWHADPHKVDIFAVYLNTSAHTTFNLDAV